MCEFVPENVVEDATAPALNCSVTYHSSMFETVCSTPLHYTATISKFWSLDGCLANVSWPVCVCFLSATSAWAVEIISPYRIDCSRGKVARSSYRMPSVFVGSNPGKLALLQSEGTNRRLERLWKNFRSSGFVVSRESIGALRCEIISGCWAGHAIAVSFSDVRVPRSSL